MNRSRFASLSVAVLLLVVLVLVSANGQGAQAATLAQAGTATPSASSATPLKPGDKIGDMTVSALKTSDDIGITLPELANFCAYHSQPVSTTYSPGTFPANCVVKPLDALVVGPSWFVYDKALLDKNWAGIQYELAVDGQPVDLKSFGTVELTARNGKGIRRIWGVVLNHLSVGKHTIRQAWELAKPINDGQYNNQQGIYAFTYSVTVHECPVQLPAATATSTGAAATMAATAAGGGSTINLRPSDYGITDGAVDECGARIFGVATGSAADKSGLQPDDVIVAVNGVQLTSRLQALSALSAALPGKAGATLTVERDGAFVDIAWKGK